MVKEERAGAQSLIDSLATVLEPRIREIAEEAVRTEEDLRSYSYKTAMERLEISEYHLRRMIAVGKLEVVYPTEGSPRITARSVRRFLYGDKVGSALPSPSER
jgi:hypothetical protein